MTHQDNAAPVNPTGPRQLLRLREVEEILGLSRSTIERLVAAGDLDEVRIGRSRRITESSLLTLIRASARTPDGTS